MQIQSAEMHYQVNTTSRDRVPMSLAACPLTFFDDITVLTHMLHTDIDITCLSWFVLFEIASEVSCVFTDLYYSQSYTSDTCVNSNLP